MADLDNLTNDQLRRQLFKLGLGNMPVTNTTRKVLLNKLRKSIGGGESGAAASPGSADSDEGKNKERSLRRETIHVVQQQININSDMEKKKKTDSTNNRRVTMSAAPIAKDHPAVEAKSSVRRSGRITPSQNIEQNVQSPSKTIPITNVEIDSGGDDDIPVTATNKRSSKSRSPSLSNSEMVTTSYKQLNIAKQQYQNIPEEAESSDDPEILTYTMPKPLSISQWNKTPGRMASASQDATHSLGRRTTIVNYNDSLSTRPTLSTSQKYNEEKISDSSYKRRQTIGTGQNEMSGHNVNMNIDDNWSNEQDTPYLSGFVRRLSQLKAEPLSTGSTLKRNLIDTNSRGMEYYQTHGRQEYNNTVMQQNDVDFIVGGGNFERKYRKMFFLILVVVVAIFIYIMFFTNN